MSDFNNLISNLNKKYGNYHSVEKLYVITSYKWYVKGGWIQACYSNSADGIFLFLYAILTILVFIMLILKDAIGVTIKK